MDSQKELFNKLWGMDLSASAHENELNLARDIAIKLAAQKGEITIDDVRNLLPNIEFGQWAGSVFKDERFVCTGFTQSNHKGSHARMIRKWRLK